MLLVILGLKIKPSSMNENGVIDIHIKNLKHYFGDFDIDVLSYNLTTGKEEWKHITAFAQTSPKAKVMKITDEESGKVLW